MPDEETQREIAAIAAEEAQAIEEDHDRAVADERSVVDLMQALEDSLTAAKATMKACATLDQIILTAPTGEQVLIDMWSSGEVEVSTRAHSGDGWRPTELTGHTVEVKRNAQ